MSNRDNHISPHDIRPIRTLISTPDQTTHLSMTVALMLDEDTEGEVGGWGAFTMAQFEGRARGGFSG